MIKLSIITINYNNASGLQKTMQSIFLQTSKEFEYIVVDGGSTDDSIEIIRNEELRMKNFRWISEKDSGIYHAMNKGIRMAQGEYVQFINSGDCLASDNVTEQMLQSFSILNSQFSILYGNMLKQMPKELLRDKGFEGRQPTLLDFYQGALNHSPAYIKRSLFDKYGLYDESLKMVSDWKWYLQVIVWGNEQIEYQDIDVTLFDMNGISNTNDTLRNTERLRVLQELLPEKILRDYATWSFPISQMQRVKRYPWAGKLYYLMERILFKIDKWQKRRKNICLKN